MKKSANFPKIPSGERQKTESRIKVLFSHAKNSWSCQNWRKTPRVISSRKRKGGSKTVILALWRSLKPKWRPSKVVSSSKLIKPDFFPATMISDVCAALFWCKSKSRAKSKARSSSADVIWFVVAIILGFYFLVLAPLETLNQHLHISGALF